MPMAYQVSFRSLRPHERTHRIPGMRRTGIFLGLSLSLLLLSIQVRPQENRIQLDVQVTRVNSTDGISGVTLILQGPYAANSTSLYTASAALTPDMREQIDILIASAPPGISNALVVDAARRLEAQLLGLPAPAATVAASAAEPPAPQFTGTTDTSGHFVFTNLAPGRYRVRAQRDGFFGAPPLGNAIGAPPTVATTLVIDTTPDKPATAHLSLNQGGTIAGRVRSPEGEPVPGIQVYAYQITYPNGHVTLSSVNNKTTDDHGEYRLFWLPPGEYVIGSVSRRFNVGPSPQDSFARTFYPGTIDGNAATRVRIGEGNDVAGIDIGMRAEATSRISGRVVTSIVGANGQPLQASGFFLLPQDSDHLFDAATMNYQNQSSNRTNGQFEIRGVLPGTYELIAMLPNGVNGPAMGRARVQVPKGGSVEDIILNVKPGLTVKAHLVLDSVIAPPVPSPPIRLILRSLKVYPAPFESAPAQPTMDSSGNFVFSNVPEGRYFFAATALPANFYIADVFIGGRFVFDEGFVVGSFSGDIEVRVRSNGAKLQGSVFDSTQSPVPTARVVLVPDAARLENQLLYKTAVSDSKGTFTLSGVAPGQYKLFAWKSVPGTAYMNAAFMAPYDRQGQVIRIMEGTTSNAVVKLIE
jgi:hypothetical protein